MKPLLICIEDAWKVSGRCLDQSFWTKVCKYVSFQTKLFSDHKENPKENSSVALLSLTCLTFDVSASSVSRIKVLVIFDKPCFMQITKLT